METADGVLVEEPPLLRDELDALESQRRNTRTFREFSENWMLKRAVERGLEVCIEACL